MSGNRTKKRTTLFQMFSLLLGSLIVVGLLLEGALRFLPVNEILLMQPVNAEHPALRFVPDRTMLWSNFADFSMQNVLRTNNYGFVNNQDYDSNAPLPLLAVIGDSFVEALMVPYAQTLHGRLAADLDGESRVYSFGVSGAPLSQYVAYADWARQEFHPSKMLFVIIGNDFDESLVKYKRTSGLHFFRPEGDGFKMERVDYTPGWGVKLVTSSKLLMYLLKNVAILSLPGRWKMSLGGKKYVGQTEARAEAVRVSDSEMAVEEFFRRLPAASGLKPEDICFVLDGMRPHLYSPEGLREAQGSYYDVMRQFFMEKAEARGYRVIDMQPLFVEDYGKRGLKFEYPRDGHWNGLGHGLAAGAVRESGFLDGVRGDAQ